MDQPTVCFLVLDSSEIRPTWKPPQLTTTLSRDSSPRPVHCTVLAMALGLPRFIVQCGLAGNKSARVSTHLLVTRQLTIQCVPDGEQRSAIWCFGYSRTARLLLERKNWGIIDVREIYLASAYSIGQARRFTHQSCDSKSCCAQSF